MADLAALCALTDDFAFMCGVVELDPKYQGVHFHERPHPFGLLGGLYALYIDLPDGINKFLFQAEGAGFHETIEWCRTIGARLTVAYLTEVASLFPNGRVPVDGAERDRIVFALEADKAPGEWDPLGKLDLRYGKEAEREIPARLRAWMRDHDAELKGALSASR